MLAGLGQLAGGFRHLTSHVCGHIRRSRFLLGSSLLGGLAKLFGRLAGGGGGLPRVSLLQRTCGLLHRFTGGVRRLLPRAGLFGRLRQIQRLRSEILGDLGKLLRELTGLGGKLLLAGLLSRAAGVGRA
jgi:hypothetical protein